MSLRKYYTVVISYIAPYRSTDVTVARTLTFQTLWLAPSIFRLLEDGLEMHIMHTARLRDQLTTLESQHFIICTGEPRRYPKKVWQPAPSHGSLSPPILIRNVLDKEQSA